MKTPINFLPKRKYGFEDVFWRIPRWLFSPWPSLISKWKYLAILSLKRALSFEDVVWRIPWRLLSAWPSLVSECNNFSIWLNWLMPTIKALPQRTYGLEDVVWRISIWLFSACPFLISEWNEFSYSESPCCLAHPIKFLLDTIYGLEDVVWRISRCLFSSDFLNGMKHLSWNTSNKIFCDYMSYILYVIYYMWIGLF